MVDFLKIYWRLTSPMKLLKTQNLKHDISSQVCMELSDDAKVFLKSQLKIYVQTANLLLKLKYYAKIFNCDLERPWPHCKFIRLLNSFHVSHTYISYSLSQLLFLQCFMWYTTFYYNEKSKQFPKP